MAVHILTGYLSGSVRGELEVTVTCLYLFVLIPSGTDGLKRCPIRPPCDTFNFRLTGLLLSKYRPGIERSQEVAYPS